MGKLEEKKKQKEENLLHTSFDLFTSKGFNKTSISDIVQKAGVAKGTFYLYFKDKYDVRNKLISYKASILFDNAHKALDKASVSTFSSRIIFMVDHIIDQLTNDKKLLKFIAKNLSWGVFKFALDTSVENTDTDFYNLYLNFIKESGLTFKNPEVMLFLIVELVGSSAYSSILSQEPLPIGELKPYLYETIHDIIQSQNEI